MLFLINRLAKQFKIPINWFMPQLEREISRLELVRLRNLISILIFLGLIFIPSFFFLYYGLSGSGAGWHQVAENSYLWRDYWRSFVISLIVAISVTIVDIILGIPMAVAIGKNKLSLIHI